VVVGSRWLADEVVLRHPQARVTVVPPLVARAPRKDPGARVRLNGLGLMPGHCLCVPFTVQARQALSTLMEAFAGVPMELDPQLVLMASESDWNAGAHVDFLDEEHRDAVVLTDELDALTRQDVIRHAAALLHPCVSDGVMLEALEGQALGTPVITSRVAAASELLGRGITQVAQGDVDGWHDAMVQALEGTLPAPSPRRKDANAAWLAVLEQVKT
jgi:glycosyltransferase involved in cell wall biosynthesis